MYLGDGAATVLLQVRRRQMACRTVGLRRRQKSPRPIRRRADRWTLFSTTRARRNH